MKTHHPGPAAAAGAAVGEVQRQSGVCAYLQAMQVDLLKTVVESWPTTPSPTCSGARNCASSTNPSDHRSPRHRRCTGGVRVPPDLRQPLRAHRVPVDQARALHQLSPAAPGALHRANGGFLIVEADKLLTEPFVWDALKRALHSRQLKMESPLAELGRLTAMSLARSRSRCSSRSSSSARATSTTPCRSWIRTSRRCSGAGGLRRRTAAARREPGAVRPAAQDAYLGGGHGAPDLGGRGPPGHLQRPPGRTPGAAVGAYRRSVPAGQRSRLHPPPGGDERTDKAMWSVRSRPRRPALVASAPGCWTTCSPASSSSTPRARRWASATASPYWRSPTLPLACRRASPPPSTRAPAASSTSSAKSAWVSRSTPMGVMILTGYLGSRYAQEFPLSISASIALEQSYGYVDGDSASLGEACTLISALSRTRSSSASPSPAHQPVRRGAAGRGREREDRRLLPSLPGPWPDRRAGCDHPARANVTT